VVKVGRDTRYPSFTSILPILNQAVDLLPTQTRLMASRAMAEARAGTLRSFLSAIEEEAGDMLH
jgi:uncharacterized protein